jgi:hypothetical protein
MTNILVNPGTTTAVATVDIGGGVESPRVNLISATGGTLYGVAGTPPGGTTVLSVQGVAGGTVQPVSGTVTLGAGTAAVGTATALQGGTWTVGLSAGTNAVGTTTALQGGTWNIGTVTNLSQLAGAAISMNTGVRDAGTQRVTIATNDVVPSSQSGTWTVQPGNTPNTAPWLVTVASGTTAAIGAVTQSGTWTVQPGNTPNTSPWLVAPAAGIPFPVNMTQIGTATVSTTVAMPSLLRDGAGNARFAAVNASNQLSVSVDGGTLNAQISSTATLNTNLVQVGSATINLGAGTGGTGTQRIIIDSSQLSALGQGTMATSVSVAIASDQSAVPVSINSGTAIIQYALPANSVSTAIGAITGSSIITLLGTPGSGQRNYLTQLLVTNAHATTSTVVVIGDGSAAATMAHGYAVAAGGGFAVTYPQPLRQPTTNTALSAYCVTTGSSIYISASGFKGA